MTNVIESIVNITVRKSQYIQTILHEYFGSCFVVVFTFGCIMMRTVYFDYQTGLITVKICNEIIYNALFIYFDRIML